MEEVQDRRILTGRLHGAAVAEQYISAVLPDSQSKTVQAIKGKGLISNSGTLTVAPQL